jgi:superfamily II RNA helicase
MIHEISYDFELDSFQKNAIEAVEKGCSVMVSAPTGSGKTVIAEHVIKKCLNRNVGVIYTAPIKALSNQKFREFNGLFPDKVGILTGDVNMNSSAPLLIMTTEIFRNRILENKSGFSGYSWIIFDEIHYLDDIERGTVWEESLIFLPEHMKMVGLSATIPNIQEFSSWLEKIHHHEICVIREESRPVPLHFFFQYQGKIINDLDKLKHLAYGRRKAIYVKNNRGKTIPLMIGHSLVPNKPELLMKHLLKSNRIPCIYFAFGRKRCEYLAEKASAFEFVSPLESREILDLYDKLCLQLHISGAARTQTLRTCLGRGVAYHHAGIHPMLKEIVEQLFSFRTIKIIFTTETFALGINMPARTVVLDELRKKYGKFFRRLKTRDFFQMAGRSGRRGIDKEGFVYSRINPHELNFLELKQLLNGNPEPIRSRFNISYATLLNLYEIYGEELTDIYPLSFHFFQERNKKHSWQLEQMKLRLNILKNLNYIQGWKLTDKGRFAKKMYGYELPLSECYASGILEKLNSRMLGVLCLAVVYEPRVRSQKVKLNHELKSLCSSSNRIIGYIHRSEKKYHIKPLSKRFYYDLSFSIMDWMDNQSFEKNILNTNHDEGEIIRFYRMAIQVLREMKDTPVSVELKERIDDTIAMINRDVIDAENQLMEVAGINLK